MRIQRSTSTILRVKELESLTNLIDRNDDDLQVLLQSVLEVFMHPRRSGGEPLPYGFIILMKILLRDLAGELMLRQTAVNTTLQVIQVKRQQKE